MNPVARGRSQVGSQYYGVPLESAWEWLFLSCCQMILLWGPASSPIVLNVFLNSLPFKEWCEMKSTTDLDGGSWTETSLCMNISQIAIELYMDFAMNTVVDIWTVVQIISATSQRWDKPGSFCSWSSLFLPCHPSHLSSTGNTQQCAVFMKG